MGDIRSILFVCLGNVCRSTLAEAVFIDVAKEKGVGDKWFADSVGTGAWHRNQPPDRRTLAVLEKNGIHGYTHSAKQLTEEYFNKFDYIMGMDNSNVRDIDSIRPNGSKAEIYLFGSFDNQGSPIIQDPYYNTQLKSFDNLYQKVRRTCGFILEKFK